jgi:hypothetical protein
LEGEVKDEVLLVDMLARGAEIKGDTVKREVCCLGRDGWMDWRLQQVAALHFARLAKGIQGEGSFDLLWL